MNKLTLFSVFGIIGFSACTPNNVTSSLTNTQNSSSPSFTIAARTTEVNSEMSTITSAPIMIDTISNTPTVNLVYPSPSSFHPTRFIETEMDVIYSYYPPIGWEARKNTAFGGDPTEWFYYREDLRIDKRECILWFSESYEPDSSLGEFVKRITNNINLASVDQDIKIIYGGKFNLDSGLDAYKLVFIENGWVSTNY